MYVFIFTIFLRAKNYLSSFSINNKKVSLYFILYLHYLFIRAGQNRKLQHWKNKDIAIIRIVDAKKTYRLQ